MAVDECNAEALGQPGVLEDGEMEMCGVRVKADAGDCLQSSQQ